MGIGFTQPTTRNSLVSVHADSKGLRIEASKETEMLQDGKSSENHVYGIQDTICDRRRLSQISVRGTISQRL
jgi:hypothetical protein